MTDRRKFPSWTETGSRKIADERRESEFTPALRNFTFSDYAAATNGGTSVIELIGPIVIGEGCLIVTGYQDLLSALSIIMEVRPGITFEAPGSLRILFGTNTDNLRFLTGPRQPLPDHVKRHYTLQTGVFVRDTRDLRALQAREAIRNGAISIRVFDEEKAEKDLGRPAGMMHANLFLNDEFAVAGSANFSRHGMASNIEFADRAMAGAAPAHEERRKAGEAFWSWGVDWNDETLEILDRLLRDVSPTEALGRTLDELTGFQAWRPASSEMGAEQEDLVYAAAQSTYEHGFALLSVPAGPQRSLIGRAVGSLLADMYERCVMRDDGANTRRQGAVALVSSSNEGAWRRGRRGALRILPSHSDRAILSSEMETVAAVVIEEAEKAVSRHLAVEGPHHVLPATGGHWAVAMSSDMPGGLAVEAALDLVETAGGPAMSTEVAEALARPGSVLFPGRTGKRARKSAAKQEAAQLELLEALGPMQFKLKDGAHKLQYREISVQPSPAARKQLDAVSARLEEILGCGAETERLRSGAHDLVSELAVSIEAARLAWDGGLAAKLGTGQEQGSTSQGMLPMFAMGGEASKSDASDRLRDALFSKELDGLDRQRIEAAIGAAAKAGSLVLVAETPEQVSALIGDIDAATDRLVVHVSDAGGHDQAGTTENGVVAAGETVGRRGVCRCALDEVRSLLAQEADDCVVVMTRDDLVATDLAMFASICLLSSAPDLKSMAQLAGLIGERQKRPRSLDLHCVDLQGLPLAASGAARDRAFRLASQAGGEGRLGPDLVAAGSVLGCLCDAAQAGISGHLLDEVESMRSLVGGACGPRDSRGAEIATLHGAPEPFTAYVLAGKTGRRGEAFMPPRLVVVKQTTQGEEIVRGQLPALSLLRSAYAATGSKRGGESDAERGETLEAVSRHLAQITHWDVRPERVRSLLASLASFMNGGPMQCDGASVLGDLTLPSLELVADRWAAHLAPVAARLRTAAEERREKKGIHDPLLDLAQVERAVRERPSWEVDGVKAEMAELIEDLRFADREKVKTIQDRVVVVIRAKA